MKKERTANASGLTLEKSGQPAIIQKYRRILKRAIKEKIL